MGDEKRVAWGASLLIVVLSIMGFAYTSAEAASACPNEAFRAGPSAALPDCRAYELVTPPNSNGRMLEVISTFTLGRTFDLFPTELGSPSRDSFVYTTYAGPLLTPAGANGAFDVYATERTSDGWITNRHISPASTGVNWSIPGGIGPDHLYAFVNIENAGYLISPQGDLEPIANGRLGTEPNAQGRYISDGGQHVIFTTGDEEGQNMWCNGCPVRQLEPDAPPTGTGAVYDREAVGETHVVSLLPSDVPLEADEEAFYKGTSKDGSTTAFEVEGILYVRLDNEVTKEVASGSPIFAGVSDSGAYVFYVLPSASGEAGEIHRFETNTGKDDKVNPGDEGLIVNVSGDGSHVYFISREALTGIEENEAGETARPDVSGTGTLTKDSDIVTDVTASEGAFLVGMEISGGGIPNGTTIVAVGPETLTLSNPASQSGATVLSAGFPNLYVWSGDSPEYVTTVLPSDLISTSGSLNGVPALTNWTEWVTNPPLGSEQGPGADSSRTTPDGNVLVFESRAQLTPYDNRGHTEIYRYDGTTKDLLCVSCGSESEPATSDARLQELHLVGPPFVINNVTDDGSRVFYETTEALVKRDTNGTNDIYEWQKEGDSRSALISSGLVPEYPLPEGWESPFAPVANLLLSVTPDGSDVFFTAKEALVEGAGENGTQAIYDARVDGGFPAPPASQPCAEEECRQPTTGGTTSFLAPLSEAVVGRGNVKPRKHRCRRTRTGSTRKKHRRCPRHHRKRAHSSSFSKANRAVTAESDSSASTYQEQQAVPTTNDITSAASASSVNEEFGIELSEAELSSLEAGAHPDFTTTIELNSFEEENGKETASANAETIALELPPGLIGNPKATPSCSTGDFVSFGNCSPDAQVGIARVRVGKPLYNFAVEPVYNLTPPHPKEEVARFGFIAYLYPVFIDVKVRTASDYGVTATVHNAPGLGALLRAKTILWGNPSSPIHNVERLTPFEAAKCKGTACEAKNDEGVIIGERASTIPADQRQAFMTNPSACQEGKVDFSVTTYQLPGQIFEASAPLAPITDCQGLPFAPTFSAEPTTHVAGAPTGLKTTLTLPQHLGPDERATATMREARVTLPAGLQIAAGAANWIGTCTEEQVGYHQEVDVACPDAAKLGTATITSPALSVPIEGEIYQRNPTPGHQFGLWLTADALGLHIKLPGELEPDKNTGRLTAVFRDLPQVPVETIELDVWGGPRAPLQNPTSCGTYTTDFSFAPHSDDPVASGQSSFTIDQGCDQGFSPTLNAGVTEPIAGRFSPFVFDLTRDDGQQALRGFELTLPDGELAKLAGVPLCPDEAANNGSCPAGSRIGSLRASTGPGPDPLQIPQPGRAEPRIHLAGPYQGAPFSIVSEVPAQAGPFDLGTLAVRSGLDVDPETARATVKADPLPQFFEGVGIAYRNLHAVIDRPGFSLNPTDCREMVVNAKATSTQGTVAHPAARFQVDGCRRLGFKPRLSLKLKGGTRRADYPALTAVLKARKGDANIARTSVALPHSEFLAQEHIQTICTRVQFAADSCPKGSIYGRAKAWTPLLDKPLSGPVYLRSSDHPLPDLVAAMDGELEIDLVGRIDSKGGGIRTTFDSVPDAPVTKFVLQMRGGKKGLLVNSTDICRGSHRAAVAMRGQNGRAKGLRPQLQSSGCPKKKLGKHKQHR